MIEIKENTIASINRLSAPPIDLTKNGMIKNPKMEAITSLIPKSPTNLLLCEKLKTEKLTPVNPTLNKVRKANIDAKPMYATYLMPTILLLNIFCP